MLVVVRAVRIISRLSVDLSRSPSSLVSQVKLIDYLFFDPARFAEEGFDDLVNSRLLVTTAALHSRD